MKPSRWAQKHGFTMDSVIHVTLDENPTQVLTCGIRRDIFEELMEIAPCTVAEAREIGFDWPETRYNLEAGRIRVEPPSKRR